MEKGSKNNSDGLDFIKDQELRKNIEGSIEYMYLLYDRTLKEMDKDFKMETYRVITLYVASIIEAVFLYTYRQKGKSLIITDYKLPSQLTDKITHKDLPRGRVVIIVQIKREAKDREMTFDKLITFFEEEKLMPQGFLEKVRKIKDIRNTFHLSMSRKHIKCDTKAVEESLKVLVDVLNKVPIVLGG